jgi:hypothetical protein
MIHYLIVGSGKPEAIESLRQTIDRLGLGDHVHYLGFRHDIGRILDAVDFLVLPSLTESFSLVTAEAMGAGKPAIVTDCGGPAEIVVDGETGFVVAVSDPRSLCRRIVQLAGDATMRREMGASALRRFNEKFRAERYSASFEGVYREVTAMGVARRLSQRERVLAGSLAEVYQHIHAREQVVVPPPRRLRTMLNPRRWASRIVRELRTSKGRQSIFGLPPALDPSHALARYLIDPD